MSESTSTEVSSIQALGELPYLPTLSDSSSEGRTAPINRVANRMARRQSIGINAVMTFRVLLSFSHWDRAYRCPAIEPNVLIGRELSAMWTIIESVWRNGGQNWDHLNYRSPKVIMALLMMAKRGQNLCLLANGMTQEQKEKLQRSNNGITLLLLCRVELNVVIMGPHDQHQLRLALRGPLEFDQVLWNRESGLSRMFLGHGGATQQVRRLPWPGPSF